MKGLEPGLEPALAQDRHYRVRRGRALVRIGMQLGSDPWGNGRQKDQDHRIAFVENRYSQADQLGANPVDGCPGFRRRIHQGRVASMLMEPVPK